MKNNLAAKLIHFATLPKLLLGFCLTGLVFLFCGCSSFPSAEQFLFKTTTNTVSVVAPVATNIVTKEITVTNATGQIIVQPIKETVVVVATNEVRTVEVKPSQQAQAIAGSVAAIADMFAPGVGKLTLLGGVGALGVFGVTRQRRLNAALAVADEHETDSRTYQTATEALSQSIEVFREVLKQTPQGAALNARLTDMLQRHQMTAGVLREVATVVQSTVDNDAAKRAAAAILATLPQEAKS